MLFDKEIFELFKMTLKKEGSLNLPAQGCSMYPFIEEGDICNFNECNPFHLKKGDIILFYTSSNRLIAHRYYKEMKSDQQPGYLFKGDTNVSFDHTVQLEQLIGKLVYVQKRNSKLHASGFLAKAWGGLILTFPFISRMLRKHLNLQQRVKGRLSH